MKAIYILVLIIIVSVVQAVVAKKKGLQEKSGTKSINTDTASESYQHFPSEMIEDPYNFLTADSYETLSEPNGVTENLFTATSKTVPKSIDYSQVYNINKQCDNDNISIHNTENDFVGGFDARKAIIYSEIIKPKFDSIF